VELVAEGTWQVGHLGDGGSKIDVEMAVELLGTKSRLPIGADKGFKAGEGLVVERLFHNIPQLIKIDKASTPRGNGGLAGKVY
jgi:hypothetical protein